MRGSKCEIRVLGSPASDYPSGIDTSQKTKKKIRISLFKNVIYTELLKKIQLFSKASYSGPEVLKHKMIGNREKNLNRPEKGSQRGKYPQDKFYAYA